jgi:hypothetical protein
MSKSETLKATAYHEAGHAVAGGAYSLLPAVGTRCSFPLRPENVSVLAAHPHAEYMACFPQTIGDSIL